MFDFSFTAVIWRLCVYCAQTVLKNLYLNSEKEFRFSSMECSSLSRSNTIFQVNSFYFKWTLSFIFWLWNLIGRHKEPEYQGNLLKGNKILFRCFEWVIYSHFLNENATHNILKRPVWKIKFMVDVSFFGVVTSDLENYLPFL